MTKNNNIKYIIMFVLIGIVVFFIVIGSIFYFSNQNNQNDVFEKKTNEPFCKVLKSEEIIAMEIYGGAAEEIPLDILNLNININGKNFGKVSDYRDYSYSRYIDKDFIFIGEETITEYINEPRKINGCFMFGYEPPIEIVLDYKNTECQAKNFNVCLS